MPVLQSKAWVFLQVFVVAIKRSGKSASWAVQYARLCSNLKAAAQPLSLDDTVQDALYGRYAPTPKILEVSAQGMHVYLDLCTVISASVVDGPVTVVADSADSIKLLLLCLNALGRSTEEYCRMTFRTVMVDRYGRQKHPEQVCFSFPCLSLL